MDWERRDDGELKLVVLRDVEIAVAEGEALALRIEYAEVQEQPVSYTHLRAHET